VKLYLEHLFWDAIRLYGGGYYQFSDYISSSGRRDDTINGNIGIGYLFFDKRFEISAEYNYTNRDSNQTGFKYTENQVFFRLSVHHDFGK